MMDVLYLDHLNNYRCSVSVVLRGDLYYCNKLNNIMQCKNLTTFFTFSSCFEYDCCINQALQFTGVYLDAPNCQYDWYGWRCLLIADGFMTFFSLIRPDQQSSINS